MLGHFRFTFWVSVEEGAWRGGGETLPGKENLGQEPRNLGDQKRKIIRHRAFSPLAENLPEAEESLPGELIPSG